MKLIITQNIDGFEIITGIYNPSIDPVETSKKVSEKIKETDVYKHIEMKKDEIKNKMVAASQARQSMNRSKVPEDQKKYHEEFILRIGQVNELQKDIENKLPELENERIDLSIAEAVYFETKDNEHLKTFSESEGICIKMQAATDNGNLLDINENEVSDNRGIVYWEKSDKWYKTEIEEIGVNIPPSGIVEGDLSNQQKTEIFDQIETERVSGLDQRTKDYEKSIAIENAASQAGDMLKKLEIQNDPDPIGNARSWYNEQVVIIEDKYK